jgi:tyrosyl-tRNA synthetase
MGTDGHLGEEGLVGEKMSKSLGNYIGVDDPPSGENGMYGKLMSVCDPLMWHYFELLSAAPPDRYRELKGGHPKVAKQALALEITTRYHGAEEARRAAEEFEKVHPSSGTERGVPAELETVRVTTAELYDDRRSTAAPTFLPRLLVKLGVAKSNSDARRLIGQKGVTLDGDVVADPPPEISLGAEHIVRVGKRHFRRFVLE